jgi:hypothetical protein
MDSETGRFYRHPEDRVMPGKHMRDCLETNKYVLHAIAKKAGVRLAIIVAAYHNGTVSREQWHKIAEVFRLVR